MYPGTANASAGLAGHNVHITSVVPQVALILFEAIKQYDKGQ
jgi:hypothetical protein